MDVNVKIILGEEYDQELKEIVYKVLVENGAMDIHKSWGVAGSQEVETMEVKLGDKIVVIESETFIGLTIEGQKLLVEDLAKQISDRKSKNS